MSKSNNQNEASGQESKVMTKYDRKMQAYQEQQKKEKAKKVSGNLLGIVVVVIVAALVLSFPIKNYLAVNGAYITVGGEKITKVEFDYHYAMAKTSFLAQRGYYLSMMGIDANTVDNQMYSGDMTFRDYFEQQAVNNIRHIKAMKAEAQAAGFSYDTDEKYAETIADLKERAAENSMTFNKYIKSMLGSYATESRLENVIREGLFTTAYFEHVADGSEPTDEEIDGYYEEHKNDYDAVDYYLTTVEAQLPTAAPDGSATLDADGNEVAYQPTEEEIAAAMEVANQEAQDALATVAAEDNFQEAKSYNSVNSLLRTWIFDEARVEGDTTVVEDTTNHSYLVASFGRRYRVETPTVDVRAITSSTVDAQSVLEEWQGGAATEESFIELCKKYDESGVEDGLYEGIGNSGLGEDIDAWLSDAGRSAGDTAAFTLEGGTNYVFYYLGTNDPVWKLSIQSLLLNQNMMDYLERISEDITVEDPKGRLNYLKIEAAASEEAENQEEASDTSEEGSSEEESPEEESPQGDTDQ
ncbi:MAG: SurA N-terminal domain-containing protein [bacterium]|nr:SurA N-terminal domain-containing protein [bacterium]MCM1374464.1 SurA N-terminal domain-containing protein [Muribaculum sp.]